MRSGSLMGASKKVTQHLAAQDELLLDRTIDFVLHLDTFTEIALHFAAHYGQRADDCRRVVEHDYIHKVSLIIHDNLQRESHKPYGPPTSVT
jgi:hypothetical protein